MKYILLLIPTAFALFADVYAQPGINGFELDKPAKFENRKLASEKTGEKKFTVPRRFIQNTVTHYNYYYNANARLNEIIERSKTGFRDDYTQLLPFYNYDLKTTAQYKQDLDSIIYKSTAGILLHDLRNSFIDNLYLLIGKSYYFRNELDSAYLTFQYLNYAFSPKEKDGWDKVIGSNSNEGGNVFSVSTKENNSIFHRAITQPPSRNESFIWQIRTLLADDQLTAAAGLIETFKHDPLFPARLDNDLKEVQAWWFYKQNIYDSAAFYLTQALENTPTQQERARWEYLVAQLYERAGQHDLAKTFYKRASLHTIDPLLEVYSILNSLRQDGTGNEAEVRLAINGLLKMARKDKYYQYRDIIYYTAANIEEEHNNPDGAVQWLLKSIQYSLNNPDQKSASYLALGDISFAGKQYVAASAYYDSVNTAILPPDSVAAFTARQLYLERIAINAGIVDRQDSLLRIAALPEEEREALIKDLARQFRKKEGRRGRQEAGSGSAMESGNKATDLFNAPAKGEWYFSNASLKTKGQAEFKSRWGNRPNADNWRRSAAVSQQFAVNNADNNPDLPAASDMPPDNSYEGLMARVPLTEPLKKAALDSIEHALFELGKAYQNGPEEYDSAISAYERLLSVYPASQHAEEAWFNLYYCYGKAGRPDSQRQAREVLNSRFGDGSFTIKLSGLDQRVSPDSLYRKEVTDTYDAVYNLFIEGRFAEAQVKKTAADSRFGENHWTPQLLYIESVYHIRQGNDSIAKGLLNKIISMDPSGALGEKSKTLLDVVSRRKEIETYLTNLEIDRPAEKEAPPAREDNALVRNEPVKNAIAATPNIDSAATGNNQVIKDNVAGKENNLIKNNVAGKDSTLNKDSIMQMAPGKNEPRFPGDTTVIVKSVPVRTPPADSLMEARKISFFNYTYTPDMPHYVGFVMTNIDPVYVTEARNAFNRYNRENYYAKPLESTALALTDSVKMVLFGNFENAAAALAYIEKADGLAEKQIIPWLKADKYRFMLISAENLELLKNRKDMDVYYRFLKEVFPGKDF